MLHVICTRLCLGCLSVRVGDISRRSEEIVKKSRTAPLIAIIIIIIIESTDCGSIGVALGIDLASSGPV